MTDISSGDIIIGVDTHKATHVAVAIDKNGTRLATFSAAANSKGYSALEDWACTLGCVVAFGIEGTGSYGAGLSRHLLVHGHTVSCAIGTVKATVWMQKGLPARF